MSIESNIRDAIVAVLKESVPSLTTVAPDIPYRVNNYNLPMAIITPRERTVTRSSADHYAMVRTWQIRVLVQDIGLGIATTNTLTSLDVIEDMTSALCERATLTNDTNTLDYVIDSAFTGDSGLQEFAYGDKIYNGVTFTYTVQYIQYIPQAK